MRTGTGALTAYDQRVPGERPTATYLTGAVHRDELPILLVIHEDDGDWQFLDGGFVNDENVVTVHIGHVLEKHPDLGSLADLPEGWAAERDSIAEEWPPYPSPSE